MASLCCSCHPQISNLKIKRRVPVQNLIPSFRIKSTSAYSFEVASKFESASSFLRGSIIVPRPKTAKFVPCKTGLTVSASWIPHSVIASNAFTMGTVAILPFYALMVLAPKSDLTKKFMDSTVPYLLLGILYGYLLYLSWTPDTLRLMFASKYWLPELNGMVKMFSSEMTMASAWIHLLVVDLFAARQVYHDGLKNEIETRHSVSLCLLFCPVGIITHVITKVLSQKKSSLELKLDS